MDLSAHRRSLQSGIHCHRRVGFDPDVQQRKDHVPALMPAPPPVRETGPLAHLGCLLYTSAYQGLANGTGGQQPGSDGQVEILPRLLQSIGNPVQAEKGGAVSEDTPYPVPYTHLPATNHMSRIMLDRAEASRMNMGRLESPTPRRMAHRVPLAAIKGAPRQQMSR